MMSWILSSLTGSGVGAEPRTVRDPRVVFRVGSPGSLQLQPVSATDLQQKHKHRTGPEETRKSLTEINRLDSEVRGHRPVLVHRVTDRWILLDMWDPNQQPAAGS